MLPPPLSRPSRTPPPPLQPCPWCPLPAADSVSLPPPRTNKSLTRLPQNNRDLTLPSAKTGTHPTGTRRQAFQPLCLAPLGPMPPCAPPLCCSCFQGFACTIMLPQHTCRPLTRANRPLPPPPLLFPFTVSLPVFLSQALPGSRPPLKSSVAKDPVLSVLMARLVLGPLSSPLLPPLMAHPPACSRFPRVSSLSAPSTTGTPPSLSLPLRLQPPPRLLCPAPSTLACS